MTLEKGVIDFRSEDVLECQVRHIQWIDANGNIKTTREILRVLNIVLGKMEAFNSVSLMFNAPISLICTVLREGCLGYVHTSPPLSNLALR